MKNLKHLFTALLLLCGTIAFAENVTIDGIRYNVIIKAKQATVVRCICSDRYVGIVIPATIEYNGVTCDVVSIGEFAFDDCGRYFHTSITIPNSVTSIGEGAFYGCSWLTSIEIPNSVTSIGESAFAECSGLTSIEIPNSVTSIGEYAFAYCSGLTSIEIPNSVTSIGEYAFADCSELAYISVASGNTVYDSRNNCNAIIETATNALVIGCKNTIIPNSVTSIGNEAFRYCRNLTSVKIPNSVTSIGYRAFQNCSSLTSVTIGNGVEAISSSAFANCSNLVDVYCLAINAPTTDSYAFDESYPEYMTLHVPAEALNDYKTTEPWNYFGHIVTLDGEVVETPVCATPVISYNNYKLVIECETEGAEFVTKVTSSDIDTFYDTQIDFSVAYNISVYAIATGYENSETVNATLCWIENGNGENDTETNVINVPATALFITSINGALYINCALNGERVEVCSINGAFIDEAIIENCNAIVQTGLSKGSVAIVKIGNKSVKVIVD